MFIGEKFGLGGMITKHVLVIHFLFKNCFYLTLLDPFRGEGYWKQWEASPF